MIFADSPGGIREESLRAAPVTSPSQPPATSLSPQQRSYRHGSDKIGLVAPRFFSLSARFSASLVAVAVLLLLPGCGQFFPPADQIVALSISPLNSVVLPSGTQQYTATATYGNNTTGDATSVVTWSSSVSNIATISATGLATAGTTLGTTTITAKSGSVIANTGLTVSNQTVTSVTVAPSSVSLISGATQQLSATANLSNNTTQIVTSSATWKSSDTTVATVSAGLVTAVSSGTATITATYGGQTGSSTVTVQ